MATDWHKNERKFSSRKQSFYLLPKLPKVLTTCSCRSSGPESGRPRPGDRPTMDPEAATASSLRPGPEIFELKADKKK